MVRKSIVVIFLISSWATCAESADPGSPRREPGGFGFFLAAGPAVVGVDYGKEKLYLFASTSVIMPILSYLNSESLVFGLGRSIKMSERSGWRIDLLGSGCVGANNGAFLAGVGLVVGFHCDYDSGFTFGFKIPFFGMALSSSYNSIQSMLGNYYLLNLMSLPVISVGYRFR